MRGPRLGFWLLAAFVALACGALWLQHESVLAAASERDAVAVAAADLARARAEHGRLQAVQIAPEQLAAMRADHAAVARLRNELEALRREADQRPPEPAPAPPPKKIPAAEWKNAGRATPTAAVETVLWAAAGGDVDALAKAVVFDAKVRPSVDAFFAALPPAMREQHGTPERLVAFFTAKDIPLGAMTIVGQKPVGADGAQVALLLESAEGGTPRKAVLSLQRDDDGWRLRVPPAAVQNYANMLGAALSASPATPAPTR
jgi:hypothetical protein